MDDKAHFGFFFYKSKKMSPEQTKWLLALIAVGITALALSVPPSTEPDASSQKAFDEVGDWMRENFGSSWYLVIGVGLALCIVALSAMNATCQWTLLAVASMSGMLLTLMGSQELSANEFRAWCLANAGIVCMALYSIQTTGSR